MGFGGIQNCGTVLCSEKTNSGWRFGKGVIDTISMEKNPNQLSSTIEFLSTFFSAESSLLWFKVERMNLFCKKAIQVSRTKIFSKAPSMGTSPVAINPSEKKPGVSTLTRWWFQIFFEFSPRTLGKMNPF